MSWRFIVSGLPWQLSVNYSVTLWRLSHASSYTLGFIYCWPPLERSPPPRDLQRVAWMNIWPLPFIVHRVICTLHLHFGFCVVCLCSALYVARAGLFLAISVFGLTTPSTVVRRFGKSTVPDHCRVASIIPRLIKWFSLLAPLHFHCLLSASDVPWFWDSACIGDS